VDPVTFAEARLDEEQADAEACLAPEWHAAPFTRPSLREPAGWILDGRVGQSHRILARGIARFDPDGRVFIHAARHDPARVLRDVKAGRRILARYRDCLDRIEDPAHPAGVARDQAREYEDFVLPSLLARWADHPDYDPAWKPED
jgi:Family of unknown function (DUF6221)